MATTTPVDALATPDAGLRAARLAVATIFCGNGLALANWLARIPDAKQRLGMSDATLGVVLLFAAIGALVAQPTVGWLIGRFGSRRLTTVMAVLFPLSMALPGLVSSVPQLMAALLVLGACNGGLDVAMNAQAATIEHRYHRPIMSSFHGLWSVGGLLGALIGGWAAGLALPLDVHLLVTAGVALVVLAGATRWLVPTTPEPGAGPSFALPPRALAVLGLVAFGVLFCEGAVGDWSAVYLRESMGAGAGLAAAGYAVFALLMAGGRLSGDWLTLRLGPARIVRGGGVLVTLGIALTVAAAEPLLAIVGFGLVGAGVACVFPLILSAAARTPGVIPSTAIAAMATAGYTGFLAGPPLLGGLAEAFSLRVALGVLGLLGVLVVALGRAVEPKR